MRLLHEIVAEEIDRFYPALPKNNNGVFSVDIPALQADMLKRKLEFVARLENDPALARLCLSAVSQIMAATQAPSMRAEQRQDAYTQAVVEAITIWERANEKFNEQMGIPKQLPPRTA